jgi:crotonobetainyl-CoA:carnitine CoA-transferase CaiB-like acyl-CoA transferase
MTTTMPLRGIRVLEFSHMVMGPSAGMILADLGATVTKIEPLSGDSTRKMTGTSVAWHLISKIRKRMILSIA